MVSGEAVGDTPAGADRLLGLPVGTLLRIGGATVPEVTGLRRPRLRIDAFFDREGPSSLRPTAPTAWPCS